VTAAAEPAPLHASGPAVQRVDLKQAIVNLEVAAFRLNPRPSSAIKLPSIDQGTLYTGTIMRRLPGDKPADGGHYVPFAVRYLDGIAVQAWCDLNDNQDLSDEVALQLTGHPASPKTRAFLVDLRWDARAGWKSVPIERKVRIVLDPIDAGRDPAAHEQYVFAMIGKIALGGSERDIVLSDGDADGVYTRGFGDGFFVDADQDRRFVIDPMSPDFGPFSVPFTMGGRRYEARDIDPLGRSFLLLDLGPGGQAEVAKVGQPAPDFHYRSSQGMEERLTDHRGGYVVLWFWSSWCSTCDLQADDLVALEARYRARGVVFRGISYDTDRESMERFRARHRVNWPTAFSGRSLWEDPIGRLYQAEALGSLYLIDPRGVLRGTYRGPAELQAELDDILGLGPAAPGRP
jgi:peroxiredoxin